MSRQTILKAFLPLSAGLLAAALLVLLAADSRAAPGVPPLALDPPRNAVMATLSTQVSATCDEPIATATRRDLGQGARQSRAGRQGLSRSLYSALPPVLRQ